MTGPSPTSSSARRCNGPARRTPALPRGPVAGCQLDYSEVNVEDQTGESTSLLEHYRKLIQLRNEHSALRVGETYVPNSDSSKLVAYLRASEEETILSSST